jgi:hypothetical protein
MKIIKYNFLSCRINHGTEEEPNYEDVILPKEIRCTAENLQANEAIAQKEAYNGEYTIEDDGQPDPEPTPSGDDSAMWDELDAAYQEGVDSV